MLRHILTDTDNHSLYVFFFSEGEMFKHESSRRGAPPGIFIGVTSHNSLEQGTGLFQVDLYT